MTEFLLGPTQKRRGRPKEICCTQPWVATLRCGHPALVRDPEAPAVCRVCGLESVPVSARLFLEAKSYQWVISTNK